MRQPKRGNRSLFRFWGSVVFLCLAPLVAQSSDHLAPGVTLFTRGKFAEAQQFFEMVIRQHPENSAVAYYLGRCAFENKQYERASTWFEQAVRLDSGNSEYHHWLGRAYGERAQHAGGEAFFLARKVKTHLEKAVALNPDNIEARVDLLEYYLQAPVFLGGDIAKARAQAVEIAKRNAEAGRKAWQRCKQEDATASGEEAAPP